MQNSDTGDVAIQNKPNYDSSHKKSPESKRYPRGSKENHYVKTTKNHNGYVTINMLKVLFNASMLNAKKLPVNSQLFTGIVEGKEGGN